MGKLRHGSKGSGHRDAERQRLDWVQLVVHHAVLACSSGRGLYRIAEVVERVALRTSGAAAAAGCAAGCVLTATGFLDIRRGTARGA
jgi:hypothetical protein